MIRKRIGRGSSCQSVPRLFAGSLEEYLEATGQELPLIVTSCIRVINLYGIYLFSFEQHYIHNVFIIILNIFC